MTLLKEHLARLGTEFVETHASWVFLGAETVWKVKKPVNFGFLDYTTIEQRHAACEAEVRLNSRLAPDVYTGVVPVTRDREGVHHIGGGGAVVDWAVLMKRLPDVGRADVLLGNGELSIERIERVAEQIAGFHARMPCTAEISRFGSAEEILANVRQNCAQTRSTMPECVTEREARDIEAEQVGFVEGHRSLFERRVRDGRIRDGHGDLRLEHVYFDGGGPPTVIDCIEFNDRFRYADVCADVAFFSMDLRRSGRSDLAECFLAAYACASHDYDLYELVDFYEGYRAHVRAKVALMLSADADVDHRVREDAKREARRYCLLALLEGRKLLLEPMVIAVGGLIASGKSTIAAQIGAMLGAPVLSADRTRKSLLGVPSTTPLNDGVWSGAYTPEATERVYAELFRRAACVLSSGRPVVFDASFRSHEARLELQRFAQEHQIALRFVECRTDPEECRRRLRRRAEQPSISDGRIEIFDVFAATFEPVIEFSKEERLVLDTSLPAEVNFACLREAIPTWPTGFTG